MRWRTFEINVIPLCRELVILREPYCKTRWYMAIWHGSDGGGQSQGCRAMTMSFFLFRGLVILCEPYCETRWYMAIWHGSDGGGRSQGRRAMTRDGAS